MKAFAIDGYADPLHAVEVPEPTVGEHDVLVDVKAASINQLDQKIAEGAFKVFLAYDFPLTLGHDLAGVVVATGTKVTRFAVGDRVYGRVRDGRIGTFAERIAVAEDDLANVPTSISLEEAASLPLVGLTAWQALVEVGGIKPGQKILVHAGAGGVGAIAIQLAKHLGATVATTVSASNVDLARSLGADIVIDYRKEDFAARLHDFDLVLDAVGGENLLKSMRILRPGGRAIGIAGPPTPAFARSLGASFLIRSVMSALSGRVRRHAKKLGVRYDFLWMHASGQQLETIARLVDDGSIRPLIGESLPFARTPDALASLSQGGHAGKITVHRD